MADIERTYDHGDDVSADRALNMPSADATPIAAIARAGGRTTAPAFDIPEHRLRMAYAVDPEGFTVDLIRVGG